MSRRRLIAAALLACALVGAGCGGDDSGDQAQDAPPAAQRKEFPSVAGKTLAELRAELPRSGPVLAPSVTQFTVGKNRFGFGLFTASRAQIANASAAVYVAPVAGGKARGPYLARYESLAVKPQFQSQSSAADPDAAKTVYVAEIPFDRPGRYAVLGVARIGGRLLAATSAMPQLVVPREDRVPGPGDKAPVIDTPTEADAGGDIESIDTRVPPSTMHEQSFADVVGKKPVVLVFATPRLCQSRVCGPVVDVAEQLKAESGDEVEFIHMEIYRDNDISKGFRPQVRAWRLPTEPWVFTIDRDGRVAARLEGAFSPGELDDAIQKALQD